MQKTTLYRWSNLKPRAIAIYFIFIIYVSPDLIYPKLYSQENISVYGFTKLDTKAANKVISEALALIKKSEIYEKSEIHKIIIVNNSAAFKILTLQRHTPFGIKSPYGIIFISDADFAKNQSKKPDGKYQSRTLSSVIAHEVIHDVSQNFFGVSEFFTPSWIKEGYADYISEKTSTPYRDGLCQIEQEKSSLDRSDIYFKYFLKIKYALEINKTKYREIASIFNRPQEPTESEIRKFSSQLRSDLGISCDSQEKPVETTYPN